MASMGPYKDGEAIEYIAFLKESYKYRLHTLLWSNHERVAAYAASTKYVAILGVSPIISLPPSPQGQYNGASNIPQTQHTASSTRGTQYPQEKNGIICSKVSNNGVH